MEIDEGMAIGKVVMAVVAFVTVCLSGCGSGGGISTGAIDEGQASYTVRFSAGPHGSLTGSTSQTVTSGSATSAVTAVPDTGYHFVNWTGDGGFVTSAANPLLVTNVGASHHITANFAADPGSARLKLASSGALPAGTSLSGIRVKVQLPAGVTVSTAAGNAVSPGVVTASGVATASNTNFVVYTPASLATPASLEFLIVSNQAGGFGVGEFATANFMLAPGAAPTADDFLVLPAEFQPSDLQLQPVTTLTAALTVTLY